MPKLLLPAQPLKQSYWEPTEKALLDAFFKIIFEPVLKVLREESPQAKGIMGELRNVRAGDRQALLQALRSGRIQYSNGIFSGKSSAAIGRALRDIGASFNSKTRTYSLAEARVPRDVREAALQYQNAAIAAHAKMEEALKKAQVQLDEMIARLRVTSDKTVHKTLDEFAKSTVAVGFKKPTPEEKKALADAYNDNMKLWVKKWSQDEIKQMRGIVQTNAEEGFRFDTLIDKIQDRYSVSKSKAKFLARQETGLFMSEYRQQKFERAGIKRYVWVTAGDNRVRPDHKILDGRVWEYDNPPVVDTATGRRDNPGKDFQCRCVDRPLLETEETEKLRAGDKGPSYANS